MKILYTHHIFSLQPYGGVSRQMYEISSYASKKIKAIIFSPLYKNYYLLKKPNELKVIGIHSIKPPFSRINLRISSLINDILMNIYLRFKKFDIVHETYYSNLSYKKKNVKYVTTIHDMIHEKFPHYFKFGNIIISAKKKSIDRADHIIVVSENTKKDLLKIYNYIDEKKVTVVYPGFYDTEKINNNKILNSKKIIKREKFILYVGLRGTYKNFNLFLKAFAKSKLYSDYNIYCFGGEPESGAEKLEWKKIGVINKVQIIRGDDQTLEDLYCRASFLIFPSIYEGFGVPPLEAMYFGCPVVCSNSSSLPEVVGDAALTFNPDDIEEMTSAIEKIVSNPELRNRLVEKGKLRVKNFSWINCAKSAFNIYEKLLNER